MGVVGIVEEVEVEDDDSIVLFEEWISSGRDFLFLKKWGLRYTLSGVILLVMRERSDLLLEFIVGW